MLGPHGLRHNLNVKATRDTSVSFFSREWTTYRLLCQKTACRATKATNPQLLATFEHHLGETRNHVGGAEQVIEMLGPSKGQFPAPPPDVSRSRRAFAGRHFLGGECAHHQFLNSVQGRRRACPLRSRVEERAAPYRLCRRSSQSPFCLNCCLTSKSRRARAFGQDGQLVPDAAKSKDQ